MRKKSNIFKAIYNPPRLNKNQEKKQDKNLESRIYNPPRLNKNFFFRCLISYIFVIYNPPRLNKNQDEKNEVYSAFLFTILQG